MHLLHYMSYSGCILENPLLRFYESFDAFKRRKKIRRCQKSDCYFFNFYDLQFDSDKAYFEEQGKLSRHIKAANVVRKIRKEI